MEPILRLPPIINKYDEFSSSLIISPVDNSSLNEDENEKSLQQQFELQRLVTNE